MQPLNPSIALTNSPTPLVEERYNYKRGKLFWDSANGGTYRRKDPKPISKKERKKLRKQGLTVPKV
jgi:hypothetical protein